jgi:hypothetical protein
MDLENGPELAYFETLPAIVSSRSESPPAFGFVLWMAR